MLSYIVRRLALMIPTLLGIMVINFAVVQVLPGGPVEQMIAQITGTNVAATARIGGTAGGDVASKTQARQSTSGDASAG